MKTILKYFLTFVAIQIACSLALGMAVTAMSSGGVQTPLQIIAASSVSNIIAIIVFAIFRWVPVKMWTLKHHTGEMVLASIVVALSMLVPSQFLEEMIPDTLRTDILAEQFKAVMASNVGFIAIAILAPIAEEVVFRGAILNWLMRSQPAWKAMVISSLLFAVVHGNPAQMPHAMLIGMLLAWLTVRTGSIVPAIIVHIVNNSLAFVCYALWPETYDMSIIDMFKGEWLYASIAIAISLAVFIPAMIYIYRLTTDIDGKDRRNVA